MASITVLGAGPTGLWVSWRLARAGHDVVLVERSDRLGGMAASFEVAGVRVDHGSHRLHPVTSPDLLGELHRLLGPDLQVRQRHGRIRLGDRWVAFPLRTGDLVRNLPLSFSVGAARDTVTSPWRRPADDSFASSVRAGLGPTVSAAFYEPYARKLWGCEPTELDAELARRRVSARSARDIATRLASRRTASARTFLYPRLGYGQITDRIADAAVDAGVEVRLGTPVATVDGSGEVTTSSGTIGGDLVVSTLPLPTLVTMSDAPDEVTAAVASLRYRAMVLVYLALDGAPYTEFDAHYLPGPETPVARLSEPRNYRDGPDPPDRTVLCAEVPCDVGDELWRAGDDTLGAWVASDLTRLGLPTPAVTLVETRRLPTVYPVYDHGFRAGLRRAEQWLDGRRQLVSVGRAGLFTPDNLHHCLAMAEGLAASVGGDGVVDRGQWERARADFATHVVVD